MSHWNKYHKCLKQSSYAIISCGDAKIVAIEHYPCKSQEELRERE